MVNVGKGRYGDGCIAAAFLEAFIEDGVKWAHLDIAGPSSYNEKIGYIPKGATGFGCFLLLNWLINK